MGDEKKPWIKEGDNPQTYEWQRWGANREGPGKVEGQKGSAKVLGLGGSATVVNEQGRHFVDGEAAIGGARLEGSQEWKYGQVGGEMSVLYAKAEGHAGVTSGGLGAQGEASAAMLQAKVTGQVGTKEFNANGSLENRQFYAEAKGQALLGSDGRYTGIALGGKAGAGVIDGTAGGGVTLPIGWLPFVPDNWTIAARGEAAVSAGSAEIAGGGYLYHDAADGRVHGGLFEGLGLGLGQFLMMDLSIGPSTPPKPPPPPKPEDYIRPMARVGDPVGAHSSSLGKLGLIVGIAAGLLLAWPMVLGAVAVGGAIGAAVGATGLAATAITSVAVGTTLVSAAQSTATLGVLGATLGKLVTFESGSPCSEIMLGSLKTQCEGKWVARINDPNSHGAGAMLKTGAERVIEGGSNVSRVGESSTCGGAKILKGASKTFVGTKSVSSGAPDTATAGNGWLDSVTDGLQKFADNKVLKYIGFVGDFMGAGLEGFLAKGLAKKVAWAAEKRVLSAAARRITAKSTSVASRIAAAKVASRSLQRAAVNAGARLFGGGPYARAAVNGTFAVVKKLHEDSGTEKKEKRISSVLQAVGVSKENAESYAKGVLTLLDMRKAAKEGRENVGKYPRPCTTCGGGP